MQRSLIYVWVSGCPGIFCPIARGFLLEHVGYQILFPYVFIYDLSWYHDAWCPS